MIGRRAFLYTVAGGLLSAPLAAGAQPAGRIYRVGFVSPAFSLTAPGLAFNRSLRDSGLIEGESVLVDRQFMGVREDQYIAVLADLERPVDVKTRPDLIVTFTGGATEAAKRATGTIPIVMAVGVYPVEQGLIASLARPGGNVTGVAASVPG